MIKPTNKITRPEMANRLARTIASDLSLYYETKIIEGLKNDNLFNMIKNEIEKGRVHYENKVDPSLLENTNFFNRALIDVLIKPKAYVKTKIW